MADKVSVQNSVALARIEAIMTQFVSRFERHEQTDITVAARLDQRLEGIERRSEDRMREIDKALEEHRSLLSDFVQKQISGLSVQIAEVSKKQSFFSGGRAMLGSIATAALALLIALFNLFTKH